jgi:glutamyl-tRNA synthetase
MLEEMATENRIAAPSATAIRAITRFAPSPTGDLHLGNARTALFNLLLARRTGGSFVLRIEDTDAERSRDEFLAQQLDDLDWLGLAWDRGPGREDERGPYRQSQRSALYERHFRTLEQQGLLYECFCTNLELTLARRAQLASGRPPRYAGTCRDLTPEQRAAKRAEGASATLRFRVPPGRRVEFTDFVRGLQSFLSDDIGDFIVRRADGSAKFFFTNAVDDAAMGITHVLRGEDHLTNTPRQLLILESLRLPQPLYGHVALLVGADGAPLSKRHGATSVREYRARGYTQAALLNLLYRLGHFSAEHSFLTLEQMAQGFDAAHLGRAPAHFDEQQLTVWQKESVHRLSGADALRWLAPALPAGLAPAAAAAFAQAVLPNVVLPEDARCWAEIVFGGLPPLAAPEVELVRAAGRDYFAAAAQAARANGNDLPAIADAARAATGRKGAALYMPLRVALTGRTHGPELAPLLKAMPPGVAWERLARFADAQP